MNQKRLKSLSLLGLVSFCVPVAIYALWIHAVSLGTTQEQRVDIFHGYFPSFLQGRFDATIISIVFCLIAVILSAMGLKLPQKLWKALNMAVLSLSALLLLLNAFSML